MLLVALARTSQAVAATSARLGKVELLADRLQSAAPTDVATAVTFLSGELPQGQIGVGYATLRDGHAPADEATLTVSEVTALFDRMGDLSGPGSQRERRRLLAELLGRATREEQSFLFRLLTGELRQGALDGVMADAIARAAAVPGTEVRRALMLRGRLGAVAEAALRDGIAGLRAFGLEVGRPLKPMLAQSADSVSAAFERVGSAAVEWKLDGVRIQVHRSGGEVAVFTRSLDDITARVPEVVEAALALPVRDAVFDGEAIALREDGRPHPFQVTGARIGSSREVARLRGEVALSPFLFDVLHLDGEDLLDRTGAQRYDALVSVVPETLMIPRVVTDEPGPAEELFRTSAERGHEGVVVKSLATPYVAGRRGAGWIKVKPRHTLDLVVLAAEWGHGRRRGWLSNLHLGARDPDGGGYVMLGKTFKGLTDTTLTWQTERLLALESARDAWTVHVCPELVVEIAFDGVQTSTRYPGGVALRFARVLRYRPDKRPEEADTVEAVLALGAVPSPRGHT